MKISVPSIITFLHVEEWQHYLPPSIRLNRLDVGITLDHITLYPPLIRVGRQATSPRGYGATVGGFVVTQTLRV